MKKITQMNDNLMKRKKALDLLERWIEQLEQEPNEEGLNKLKCKLISDDYEYQ